METNWDFKNALADGNFNKATRLLKNHGADINGMSYQYDESDSYDLHAIWVNRDIYYLVDAINNKRLDIVEYLLSQGANFGGIIADQCLQGLAKAELPFGFEALQNIIKLKGSAVLYHQQLDTGNNFLHYLATYRSNIQIAHQTETPSGLSFTYSQLQALMNDFALDKIVINQKNKAGDTPLHVAIKTENSDMVQWLLETKLVDLTIRDTHGKSAFKIPCSNTIINSMIADEAKKLTHLPVKIKSSTNLFAIKNIEKMMTRSHQSSELRTRRSP